MDEPVAKGLKEKWNDHWEKKPLQSKQHQANWAGMIFYWVCSVALLYTALKTTVRHHFKCRWDWEDDWYIAACWIIFIQCGVNWVACALWRGCNNVPKEFSVAKGGSGAGDWTHCTICQNDVPPRAFHCKICNVCVLKRDHHCFITGTCVGFYNQRHYTVFLFYAFIGSCYSLYLAIHYFGTESTPMGWKLVPVIALISYFKRDWTVTRERLGVICVLSLSIVLVVLTGYFLLLQINVLLSGRTTPEANRNIKKYKNESKMENFRAVFGPYGFVQFLAPLPIIPVSGDGLSWNTKVFSKWQ